MTLAELTKDLAAPWPEELGAANREKLLASGKTLVVLDDDPTGTQTVSDLPVLTSWSVEELREELTRGTPVFYLLTNSRALTEGQTESLHREIGGNLLRAGREAGREFLVISRSDSTLRGHYPLEVDTLSESLQLEKPLVFFLPFFEAGGRLTLNGTHYVVEKGEAVPAHETPFAQDNAFPFSSSYLPEYLVEKSGGTVALEQVVHLPLALLREGGPGEVQRVLEAADAGAVCIVDALELRDLEVLVSVLPAVEAARPVLYRSAASFVQARAGLATRDLLAPLELADPEENDHGGLIVVGSHVPKTTAQLDSLLQGAEVEALELSVPKLLENPDEVLFPLSQAMNQSIQAGKTVVLSTSRERIDAESAERNLFLSQTISRALVSLVQSLVVRPRFLVAKGGITSSDLATDAMGVKRALVLGQILPGVPVWQLGSETRFPGLPYIIFPGNVGGEDALLKAFQKLEPKNQS
ncbi:four-carbon acid sugar kinase family protein [Roseibacillus persicicus]|uniref:four-carbon acid sugar kinase family protein n=1 Tax=Roseibacillus persicicus TaxID=454148 RepID=UPI00280EF138|nr:four-carbon acid sugar kinase family protein [Roseibacillus persicicus]MDQ8189852.1 four-carbon acid sugar kinase family protein [Roseibacillus persicicus]